MNWIELDDIVYLQNMVLKQTGGEDGIRSKELLESAYYSPMASFASIELFPDPVQKIARLSWGLASNHPFLDGNKRIGALVLLVLLEKNSMTLNLEPLELSKVFYKIAEGKMSFDHFMEWVLDHIQNMGN